jgi:hypothetical protein
MHANHHRPYLAIALFLLAALPLHAAEPATKAVPEWKAAPGLKERVIAFDRQLFDASVGCDLAVLAGLVSPDLEFYHDVGGLSRTREDFIAKVKANVCGKWRRELDVPTLEIWPLGQYGAVYTGTHRFCDIGKPVCNGYGRFLHVLEEKDGKLVLSRAVSYDHHAIRRE